MSYRNQAEYDDAEPDEPEADQGVCVICKGIAPGEYEINESGDDSPDTVTFTPYDACPVCEEPLCPDCAKVVSQEDRCAACIAEDAIERSMKEATTT